jgi:hypothetical protein
MELWPLLQAETKRDIDGKQWEGMIAYKHKRGTEEKKRCPDQEQGQDETELCFTVCNRETVSQTSHYLSTLPLKK